MKLKNNQIIAHSRLRDAKLSENSELAAISKYKDDWKVRLFKSRDAMKHFCKDGSSMLALVKDVVSPGMLINRNMQTIKKG